jgi:hypothetical protein
MQGMPVPTDEHKRLHILQGNWIGEETLSPSPWGPGGPAVGKSTCRVECDGFWVSQEYVEEKDGRVTYRGRGVFGYDSQSRQFAWYWVDSMGFVPQAPSMGAWDGNTLTFRSSSPQGQGRYTYEFEGRDRYKFRIENSRDGGKTWQTFMTGDYRRA